MFCATLTLNISPPKRSGRFSRSIWIRCSAASDLPPGHEAELIRLTNFIYASFVGILNQWLASRDAALLLRTTDDLIEAARALAAKHITATRRPGKNASRSAR